MLHREATYQGRLGLGWVFLYMEFSLITSGVFFQEDVRKWGPSRRLQFYVVTL